MVRFPRETVRAYLIHKGQHTEASIGIIVANEVSTFGGLLSHDSKNLFVRFHFPDRLCLFDKSINISHDRKEVADVIITVFLVFNNLDAISPLRSRTSQDMRRQNRRTLYVADSILQAIFE